MKNKRFFGLTAALLLSIFAAGGLWAQELKFDGYFNSGIGVLSDDNDGSDTTVKFYGADAESNGYRFRLNGNYTNEAGNAGFRFRLQSQANTTGGYFSLPIANGWVRFADNILFASAGIILDTTWSTGDWWLGSNVIDWGLGAQLKATPIEGLDLGFGAYAITPQGGAANSVLGSAAGVNFGNVTPALENLKYTFSASYTQKDTFRVAATFRTKNKAGLNGDRVTKDSGETDDDDKPIFINDGNYGASSSYNYKYDGTEESSRLFADFRWLGTKGLTAVVAVSLDKLEDFSDSGNIALSETFGYKVNDELNIGLNATQFLFNSDTIEDPIVILNVWGSYTIDKVVPRLDAYYALNTTNTDGAWARTRNYGVTSPNDFSTVGIRPSVRFNLDGKTFVEIGDFFNYRLHKDDSDKNNLTNAFYIDFRWTF